MTSTPEELPVREVLPQLLETIGSQPAVILRAPPGAGKTTLVPLALLRNPARRGKIILTQPRRLAARTAAARVSVLNRSELGTEIGYQVRMERRWSKSTQVIAMTTGVLLRRLLGDPFLEEFETIVLDEFHERSLEMDLVLGMLRRLQQTVRPDLKLIVMSATIDCGPIAEYLDQATIIESPGRLFEVSVRYSKQYTQDKIDAQVAEILPKALTATPGHLLVFLPGVGEIVRTQRAIESLAAKSGCQIWQLFGDMSSGDQDRVLEPSARRKIILATNVAETSLTIDGVTGVIDSGQVRTMRYDPAVGLSRLVLESNSMASADQRAGRAGRQAPGVCFRLWPETMNRSRSAFDTPEILRGDLSGAILQLAGMGETDFAEFPWLTPPKTESLDTARGMLEGLGALAGGKVTDEGRRLLRLPVTPRLAKLLIAAARRDVAEQGAIAAALLSERDPFRTSRFAAPAQRRPSDRSVTRSDSDLVDRVNRLEDVLRGGSDPDLNRGAVEHLARTASYLLQSLSGRAVDDQDLGTDSVADEVATEATPGEDSDTRLRRAIGEAYLDRLARRRQLGSDRGVMVGGMGVKLAATSSVKDAESFVCIDVEQRDRDAEVRLASAIEFEWLPPDLITEQTEYFFHPTQKSIQARRRKYWRDLVLSEVSVAASDQEHVAALLHEQVLANWEQVFPADDPTVGNFLARVAFVRQAFPEDNWPEVTASQLQDVARQLCHGRRSLDEVKRAPWSDFLGGLLNYEQQRKLNELAPAEWTAPSGNRVQVVYETGRPPKLSVRLQELFGLAETPRLAGGRVVCLLELLGPNYRPQQLTSDLASFWQNTYPTVRKDLLRRYPKHHWPDDPLSTPATRSGLKRDARSP
ncbi:MAG: ATP-dependent helicase HrpB [Pirellulaceae bacterium]